MRALSNDVRAVFIISLFAAVAAAQSLRSPEFLGSLQRGSSASVPSVDMLLDAEGASVGVITVARLVDGGHTNANYGPYGIKPNPQVRNWVTNDFSIPLIAPVSVNGVTYTGSGDTKRFRGRMTSNTEHEFILTNTTQQGQMNVSFFFSAGPTANLGDFIDLVQIEGHGEYAVVGIQDDADANKFIRVHSNTNFGTTGPNINFKSNFWYFVSLSYDTNVGSTGNTVLELRNGTNGAFIGRSELGHGSKQMAETWRVFKTDTHTYGEAHEISIDNIMVRYNATGGSATNYLWQ